MMPPIITCEVGDKALRGFRSLGLTQDFSFETNEFPDIRIILSRIIENRDRGFIVVSIVSQMGEIESADPCPRIFLARLQRVFFDQSKQSFSFLGFSLVRKSACEIVLSNWVIGRQL